LAIQWKKAWRRQVGKGVILVNLWYTEYKLLFLLVICKVYVWSPQKNGSKKCQKKSVP
jgi:hypothetical protein